MGEVHVKFFFGLVGGFVLREAFGGAKGIEERVGDVAEDSGAARADAILSEQGEKTGEELGDVGVRAERGDFGRETGEGVSLGFGEWNAARASVELAEV